MMPDTELREALFAYSDDAPPPSFTLDQVVTAGRRRRRMRRLAVAAGVAVVVAAAGAAFALPQRNPAYEIVAPPSEPLAPCRSAGIPAIDPPSNDNNIPVPRAADRMTCYLVEAVPHLLPGATFSGDAPSGAPLQAYAGRVFDPARPAETSPPYFAAAAVVSDANGVGTIGFGASPFTVLPQCPPPACTTREGPEGEPVTVLESRDSNGYRLVNIRIYRGSTEIFVSASNGVPKTATPEPGRALSPGDYLVGRKDLPLTVDELIALAAVPELQIFR